VQKNERKGMSRGARLTIGPVLLSFPVQIFWLGGGNPFAALAAVVAGLPFMVAGAMLVAPEAGGFLARPFGNLFYPEQYADAPPPICGPAESLARRGRFEEALDACEQVLAEYPDTYRLWELMIEVLLRDLRDRERAQAVLERAKAALSSEEERRELHRRFEELLRHADEPQERVRGRVELDA